MYLGVDIGGTKTLIAAFSQKGQILARMKFPTSNVYIQFLEDLKTAVAVLKVDAGVDSKGFLAAGMAVPGRIDRDKGLALGYGNLPWPPEPILQDCERIFECPTVIENDANLAALSEAMLAPDIKRVLYVTVSTGIGTGFVVDQVLDPDLANMEGGQMMLEYKGRATKWEKFAAGSAIVKRYDKRAEDIHDAATWHRIAHDLARGFIELISVVQPEVIIIGGSVGNYFERFAPFLKSELIKFDNPLVPIPPFRQAARPDDAVVFGCYDLVMQTFPHHRQRSTSHKRQEHHATAVN